MVEVLQIFTHLLKNSMDGYIDFIHDPIIDVPNNILNYFELLE